MRLPLFTKKMFKNVEIVAIKWRFDVSGSLFFHLEGTTIILPIVSLTVLKVYQRTPNNFNPNSMVDVFLLCRSLHHTQESSRVTNAFKIPRHRLWRPAGIRRFAHAHPLLHFSCLLRRFFCHLMFYHEVYFVYECNDIILLSPTNTTAPSTFHCIQSKLNCVI